jgi:hypothetical protein
MPVVRADGTVVAVIDTVTGKIVREISVPAAVNGGPLRVSTAGGVLVISGAATAGLDARSGAVLWMAGTQDSEAISPDVTIVKQLQQLLPSFDAVDTKTGTIRWSSPQNTVAYATDAHQTVVVASGLWHQFGPGSVVDTNSGATLWTSEFSDDQHLLVAHGSLYVAGGCPPTLAD